MYYLVYAIFYLLSLLPWFIIYLISDGCYFLIYYVFKYRRQVVADNLLIAFPEKTEAERTGIAKNFYKGFTDNFIELIKLVSISESEMKKRFVINIEVVNELVEKHERVHLITGHYFNWEFANLAVGLISKFPFIVAYKPVSNKVFDRLMYHIRSRFGTKLVSSTNFAKDFQPLAKSNYALILVADQNAANTSKAYWVDFFGKKVPFVKGPERGAKMNNLPLIYTHFYKVKRGYYKGHFELVTTTPNDYKDGELTKVLIKKIEDSIKQEPSNYLWSHRRWKHIFNAEQHARLSVD